MTKSLCRRLAITAALIGSAAMAGPAAALTAIVNYTDAAGSGFRDATPVSPVGGNTGTTLGDQRKQAFEFAVNVWAQRLQSSVTVKIDANFTLQFCSPGSAQLGSAGPALLIPASGMPQANTYYPVALANAIKGSASVAGSDISAHFNSGIDAKPPSGCLGTKVFYYGLDQNAGSNISFVNVAVHELGHGFGFVSLVDPATGAAQFGDGRFGILDYSLFDENTAMALPAESNSQRAAAAISDGFLTWNDTFTNAGSSFLDAGSKTNGRVRMFAPSSAQSGSSLSHWDTVATPNLVMEPSYTAIDAGSHVDLTSCAFKDLGWTLSAGVACPDIAGAAADLTITNVDGPDPVVAGTDLTYTITLHNNGPATAQSASISVPLSKRVTFLSLAKPAGWSSTVPTVGATGTVTMTSSSIAPGATATFTLVGRVKAETPQGTSLTTIATASSATSDPTPGNNAAAAVTQVNTQANLALTVTDSPDPVWAGTNVTYTLKLSNLGPSHAQSVSVSDPLPSATRFVSATAPAGWTVTAPAVGASGTVTFASATVARSGTATFTVVAKVLSNATNNSTLTNTATVTSSTADPVPANNSAAATTTVVRRADLAITNVDSPDPQHAGSNITYTIKLTNQGPGDASAVKITDPLPAGTTFVSLTSGMVCTKPAVGATGTVVCSISSRIAGASALVTLVVKVDSGVANGTLISNTATVSAATSDPSSANNSATASTTVQNP